MNAPLVCFDDVSIGYGEKVIVRNLSLKIHSGDVLALLGTNGSGKSTMIRGLLGLADLRSGLIDIFGEPAGRHDRSRIGYVPQRNSASGPIPATVWEVVMTGRLARRTTFVRASKADRAAVHRAIELVGLADRAKAAVTELSGGQHRRVLIARALASEPDLLVLDEPTAGVDITQQYAFVAVLKELVAQGVTILVVTHELGPMLPIITRVAVLDEGRLHYEGELKPEFVHGHGDDHHHPEPRQESPIAGLVPYFNFHREG